MFCYKCGFEIQDDAQFCSKCGAMQGLSANQIVANNSATSNDFNREAMQIYLSNILTLECAKAKLNDDYCLAEKEWSYEFYNNCVERFKISNGYVWLAYHDGKFYIGAFNDRNCGGAYTGEYLNREEHMTEGKGFVKYVWGQEVLQHRGTFYWGIIDENSLHTIKKSAFWWDIGKNKSRAKKDFFKVYSSFKETAPKIHQENFVNKVQPLKGKVDGICEEWKKADELLQSAYNINIIPQQFRNIHAVWFIRDFIATSNESLTTALLHCDLDVIKQKLDDIIEQNREIIINQAVQMAQNDQMIEQNQQALRKLANIEQNTDRAAKYSQIAANNAEACAWIGLANYIKS